MYSFRDSIVVGVLRLVYFLSVCVCCCVVLKYEKWSEKRRKNKYRCGGDKFKEGPL